MNKIWIISDTHFNHPNIITKFEFRKPNYQELIIKRINNNVWENDILIHLWDVIFDNPSELGEILKKLNVKTKILIRWNHDKNWIDWYINKWFTFVVDEIRVNYLKKNIILSHKPIMDLPDDYINVHWHLHSKVNEIIDDGRHILYSPELNNYMPLLLNNMIKWI